MTVNIYSAQNGITLINLLEKFTIRITLTYSAYNSKRVCLAKKMFSFGTIHKPRRKMRQTDLQKSTISDDFNVVKKGRLTVKKIVIFDDVVYE